MDFLARSKFVVCVASKPKIDREHGESLDVHPVEPEAPNRDVVSVYAGKELEMMKNVIGSQSSVVIRSFICAASCCCFSF